MQWDGWRMLIWGAEDWLYWDGPSGLVVGFENVMWDGKKSSWVLKIDEVN